MQPWFTNALNRIVKTKLHFLDSGPLATVRGLTFDRVKADRGMSGALPWKASCSRKCGI
jgi:uncharacterized protein